MKLVFVQQELDPTFHTELALGDEFGWNRSGDETRPGTSAGAAIPFAPVAAHISPNLDVNLF